MSKKVVVIGAGFGGLTVAGLLAKQGFDVTVLEKNSSAGGRAWKYQEKGYTFDMGPSWYMMHEVFENFFEEMGEKYEDYYEIDLLSPTYKAFFDDKDYDIYSDIEKIRDILEEIEPGSYEKLRKIIPEAKYLYEESIERFLPKPFLSFTDFVDVEFGIKFLSKGLYKTYENYINSRFKSDKIRNLLSWHTVFIGGTPDNVPALYILMLYVDLVLGTYYPKGGMYSVVESMQKVSEKYGAKFMFDEEVTKIETENNSVKKVITKNNIFEADIVISNADYHHTEQKLLHDNERSYSENFWKKKTMSPSTFLVFLGINKKLDKLIHHNYYFSSEYKEHFESINKENGWPESPSLYICKSSESDASCAPKNSENIMMLVPVAPGLEESESIKEKMYNYAIDKLEKISGEKIRDHIEVKKVLAHNYFEDRFNAYKGNAFGLANTLFQTGSFRPSLKSKKIKNLYFSGTTTVPGIGMPLGIISGQIVSNLVKNNG